MVLILYLIPSFEAFKKSICSCQKTTIHEDTDGAVLTQRKRFTFRPFKEFYCLPLRQIPRSWVNRNVTCQPEQTASGMVISHE